MLIVYFRLTVQNVTGLSPGKEYQFRVSAENFYGRSEPCEPTNPIKTEKVPESKKGKVGKWFLPYRRVREKQVIRFCFHPYLCYFKISSSNLCHVETWKNIFLKYKEVRNPVCFVCLTEIYRSQGYLYFHNLFYFNFFR